MTTNPRIYDQEAYNAAAAERFNAPEGRWAPSDFVAGNSRPGADSDPYADPGYAKRLRLQVLREAQSDAWADDQLSFPFPYRD